MLGAHSLQRALGTRTRWPRSVVAHHAPRTHTAQVKETWDKCAENTLLKLAYGTIAGGVAAMILFRASRPASHPARPKGRMCCCCCRLANNACAPQLCAPSLLCAGSPAARSSIVGMGAGVGIGMGYTECKCADSALPAAPPCCAAMASPLCHLTDVDARRHSCRSQG